MITFSGTVTGACGTIPTTDMVWQAVNTATGAATQLGHGASISAYLSAGSYTTFTITFQVTDPTSGQVSSPSISIIVQPLT
jgi:hypothetical protein